jgi:hypothetical protein
VPDPLDLRAVEARLDTLELEDAALADPWQLLDDTAHHARALLTALRAAIACLKRAPVSPGYSWNDERATVLAQVRDE